MKSTRTVMSQSLRLDIDRDPEYSRCMIPKDLHTCLGRLTNEHALYFANKKVQKKFAIVKACAASHGVDQYQDSDLEVPKDMREWVALSRATWEERQSISKAVNYHHRLKYLESKYGVYVPPPIPEQPRKAISVN